MSRAARLVALAAFAIFLAAGAPAFAQSDPIGFRAFVMWDRTTMAASQSFDAVVGTSRFSVAGGGGEVTRLAHGAFLRVAATRSVSKNGTRVVVFGSEPISLGIPVTIRMQHAEIAGGWRFNDKSSARAIPYAGGGLARLHYVETSDFAETGDNADETFNGLVVFGGIDLKIWKILMAGAEVQYRTIPDAIGTSGVSKEFSEKDLGGLTVRVVFGIRK